jgi:ribosome modulation factor
MNADAYGCGYMAGSTGIPRDSNPYDQAIEYTFWQDWDDGWSDADVSVS